MLEQYFPLNLASCGCLACRKVVSGFDVFALTLCASDWLVGVYLAAVGVADRYYMGSYLWSGPRWRASPWCTAAGFLGMLSCEVLLFFLLV